MSGMKTLARLKREQVGAINILLIPLIVVVFLLIGAGAFAVWAFGGRQDYKNNVDQKVASAVTKAKQATQTADQARFDEQAKSPYKSFTGLPEFGSVTLVYPKTWSAFIVQPGASSNTPVDGYFYPDFVPDVQGGKTALALRVQVIQQSYASTLAQYTDLQAAKKVTVAPYRLPKLADLAGVRLDGQIATDKQGSMVIMPLRNQTVKVWTESSQFLNDFNNVVLPNLTFSP